MKLDDIKKFKNIKYDDSDQYFDPVSNKIYEIDEVNGRYRVAENTDDPVLFFSDWKALSGWYSKSDPTGPAE